MGVETETERECVCVCVCVAGWREIKNERERMTEDIDYMSILM